MVASARVPNARRTRWRSARRRIFAERDDRESTRFFLFIVLVISLKINIQLSKLVSKREGGRAYATIYKLQLALIRPNYCTKATYSPKTSAANLSMRVSADRQASG